MMLLCVGGVIFIFASMVHEANIYYPDADLNSSEWGTYKDNNTVNSKYDFASQVNDKIKPIKTAIEKIQDSDTGWFSKIVSGIAAIPYAVIILPVLLFDALTIGGTLITGFMTTLGIPSYIITVALIMMIVWGVFKILEAYQRWNL
jgi:hypothetical protein